MFVALSNSFKDQTQIMHRVSNITFILTDHCGYRLTFDVTCLSSVVFNFHPVPKNSKLTQVQKVNTSKTRVSGRLLLIVEVIMFPCSLLSSAASVRNVLW